MAALAEIVRHQTEQVTMMGLFYQLRPTVVARPLAGITPGEQNGANTWNAHEWRLS
jgi:hypothetical protein